MVLIISGSSYFSLYFGKANDYEKMNNHILVPSVFIFLKCYWSMKSLKYVNHWLRCSPSSLPGLTFYSFWIVVGSGLDINPYGEPRCYRNWSLEFCKRLAAFVSLVHYWISTSGWWQGHVAASNPALGRNWKLTLCSGLF